MLSFVNAKINIGLQIVSRREDGYHNLETLFYPVGLYAGMPSNPVEFCDILEIVPTDGKNGNIRFKTGGRAVECAQEENLVWRAADSFMHECRHEDFSVEIFLEKHLPDGAGMGGGSADAAFTLLMLSKLEREKYPGCMDNISDDQLGKMALRLGADCPFFLYNKPAFAEGVGEILQPVDLDMSGYKLLVVKPDVSVSTREAFAGVTPRRSTFDLKLLPELPVSDWKKYVINDFERSIFPQHPEFKYIKDEIYRLGALYASLTGSGSCLYGIFNDAEAAVIAGNEMKKHPTIRACYLLEM